MRIRTIKPEFFLHEHLAKLDAEARIAFIGLWCASDREGRFEWRPERLKAQILPYSDCDFSRVLDALGTRGFLVRYTSGTREYGWIPSFTKHQVVNNRERPSELPNPPQGAETKGYDATATRGPRDGHATRSCTSGTGNKEQGTGNREGNGESTSYSCSTTSGGSDEQQPKEQPFLTFPCNGNQKEWHLYPSRLSEYRELYPEIDVETEAKKSLRWIRDNRRKTANGMPRFLSNWMAKANNSNHTTKVSVAKKTDYGTNDDVPY